MEPMPTPPQLPPQEHPDEPHTRPDQSEPAPLPDEFASAIQWAKTHRNMVVIWTAIGLIVLMTMFPPWVGEILGSGGSLVRASIGYYFIGSPPDRPPDGSTYRFRVFRLDWARLTLQWVIVAGPAAGLLYTFSRQGKRAKEGT